MNIASATRRIGCILAYGIRNSYSYLGDTIWAGFGTKGGAAPNGRIKAGVGMAGTEHSTTLMRAGAGRSHLARYGAALALTAAALAVNFLLPETTLANRFFLFAGAVLAASAYGGFLPGLLATVLAAALSSYFFLVPVASFRIESAADIELLSLFLAEGIAISAIGAQMETPPARVRSALFRYGLALAVAAAVAALKPLAFPMIAPRIPFAFCYALAVTAAWAFGVGPALATTAVSAVAGHFLIPRTGLTLVEERIMLFILEAALLSLLVGGYRAILLRSQDYLRRLFFESPAGILVVRPDLRILRSNPAMDRMLPHRSGAIEQSNFADIIDPSSREWLLPDLSRLNPDDEPMSAREVPLLNDGDVVWAQLQAAPIAVPGEEDRCWLVTVVNVTGRHRAESALHETEARLHQAQKMEAVGLLASSIAHDFNNQLAVILGYSEDLLHKRGSDEVVRTNASEISRASRKAGEFTRQLLTFTRKKARKPQPINLNSVVNGSRLFLSRLLGDRIELVVHLDPEIRPVQADPSQMEQILLNLVANARDAMPKGGSLVVRTANTSFAEPVPAVASTIPAGDYATLTVSDTGEGMDAAVLARIFEPFFTTRAPEGGTGLGLATVHRNTQQLFGHILVSSTPGAGTVFTICFPTARPVSAPPVPGKAPAPAAPQAMSVLVVEDEDMLRALMVEVLGAAGYRVLEAGAAEDALAIPDVAGGSLDVLVSDINLPGMTGVELAAELRRSIPNLRVLYVSGDPSQAKEDPETPFLAKPFTPQELVSRIREQARGGGAAL